jgi:hypothetical protein
VSNFILSSFWLLSLCIAFGARAVHCIGICCVIQEVLEEDFCDSENLSLGGDCVVTLSASKHLP